MKVTSLSLIQLPPCIYALHENKLNAHNLIAFFDYVGEKIKIKFITVKGQSPE